MKSKFCTINQDINTYINLHKDVNCITGIKNMASSTLQTFLKIGPLPIEFGAHLKMNFLNLPKNSETLNDFYIIVT